MPARVYQMEITWESGQAAERPFSGRELIVHCDLIYPLIKIKNGGYALI